MSEQGEVVTAGGEVYRRRYVRVAVGIPVSYTREGEEAAKSGQISDLGGGGVRLASDEDLPLGSVMLLRFALPDVGRELVARGRIVLSFYNAEDKRFFHGIAFTQIDPRDQEEIIRYVSAEVQRLALGADAAD
ncbi:MAG: PilZ domain-containing protein [Candidatus Eremiobacteraeota bacterium]|nr:PilZ domain-containing protein [Candidatus Eremiobacteraeota bacterium]